MDSCKRVGLEGWKIVFNASTIPLDQKERKLNSWVPQDAYRTGLTIALLFHSLDLSVCAFHAQSNRLCYKDGSLGSVVFGLGEPNLTGQSGIGRDFYGNSIAVIIHSLDSSYRV